MPWDGYQNALFAQAHGFETFPHTVEGSLVDYENLDNHQTGIHDYFKFLKYGFGRASRHRVQPHPPRPPDPRRRR